jgi:hypothetical protein
MQLSLEKLFKNIFTVICNPASPGADQHYINLLHRCQHLTMASYNDSYPLPRNPIPSSPISIVDIFFPGFTNISAAFQQLQASSTNGYTQMLCICGIAMFFSRYAYNSMKRFIDTYFSPYLLKSLLIYSDKQQHPLFISLIPIKHTTCLLYSYPLSYLPITSLPLLLV